MNDNTWNLRRLVLIIIFINRRSNFRIFRFRETDWTENWLQTPNLTQSAWSLNNTQATPINPEITVISFRFFLFRSFRPFGRFRFNGFAHWVVLLRCCGIANFGGFVSFRYVV